MAEKHASLPPRPGRPALYCPEVHAKLVHAASVGMFRRLQAMYAGVAPRTLNEWLQHAEEHPDDSPYGQLAQDLALAEATRAEEALRQVHDGWKHGKDGGPDWNAHAWYMERKYPGEYGRRVQEIHGRDGGPLEFRVTWPSGAKSPEEGGGG